MAKSRTYAELTREIESLTTKAQAVRKQEVAGVVARIKDAIAVYGLTAVDLGFGAEAVPSKPAWSATAPAKVPKPSKASPARDKPKLPAKYRDLSGNSWTGRGPRPKWLVAALAAGQTLEDLTLRGPALETGPVTGEGASAKAAAKDAAEAAGKRPIRKSQTAPVSVAKYRDVDGHAWSGRGPKPGWVKAALAAGRTLEELAV